MDTSCLLLAVVMLKRGTGVVSRMTLRDGEKY